MLHPSYTDLMQLVNSEVETGEAPVVNSRYSIVLATSRRARQLIDGVHPLVKSSCPKPLSTAIEELSNSKIHILSEEEAAELEAQKAREAEEKAREAEEVLSFSEEDDPSGDVLEAGGEENDAEIPEAEEAAGTEQTGEA